MLEFIVLCSLLHETRGRWDEQLRNGLQEEKEDTQHLRHIFSIAVRALKP